MCLPFTVPYDAFPLTAPPALPLTHAGPPHVCVFCARLLWCFAPHNDDDASDYTTTTAMPPILLFLRASYTHTRTQTYTQERCGAREASEAHRKSYPPSPNQPLNAPHLIPPPLYQTEPRRRLSSRRAARLATTFIVALVRENAQWSTLPS